MDESGFLQSARSFQTSLGQNVISVFDTETMSAEFTQNQIGPTGHVFGGHVASIIAMWAAAKLNIGEYSRSWGIETRFIKPAPVDSLLTVRMSDRLFSAAHRGQEFASLKINHTTVDTQVITPEPPIFSTNFYGRYGVVINKNLYLDLPQTKIWHEMLYYITAACDWGIWVLGQMFYPTATFISGSLDITFTDYLCSGPISLRPVTTIPNHEKGDRVDIITLIFDSQKRKIGSARATLVNFDYTTRTKLPLPIRTNI